MLLDLRIADEGDQPGYADTFVSNPVNASGIIPALDPDVAVDVENAAVRVGVGHSRVMQRHHVPKIVEDRRAGRTRFRVGRVMGVFVEMRLRWQIEQAVLAHDDLLHLASWMLDDVDRVAD